MKTILSLILSLIALEAYASSNEDFICQIRCGTKDADYFISAYSKDILEASAIQTKLCRKLKGRDMSPTNGCRPSSRYLAIKNPSPREDIAISFYQAMKSFLKTQNFGLVCKIVGDSFGSEIDRDRDCEYSAYDRK